jgi:AcrR family transcriptional regulator
MRSEGEGVSMTRIAEVAGYSIGTLYQYFPDRRSLLCELMHDLCESDLEAILALLPEIQGAEVGTRVDRVVEHLVDSASTHRALIRALVRDVLPTLGEEDFDDLLPAMTALLAEDLEQHRAELGVRDCTMAARMMLVGVEAILFDAAVDHPESFDDGTLLAEVRALVRGFLRIRPRLAS